MINASYADQEVDAVVNAANDGLWAGGVERERVSRHFVSADQLRDIRWFPDPEYCEMPNAVKLVLWNNIDERTVRRNKASGEAGNEAINEARNEAEKHIIEAIKKSPEASQVEIAEMTGFSRSKVQRIMRRLTDEKVIYHDGARKNGVWRFSEPQ